MTNPSGEVRDTFPAMGTMVSVCLGGPSVTSAQTAIVRDTVAECESALSRFLPGSDLSRLAAAEGTWIPVSHHTARMLTVAAQCRDLTEGTFDVTFRAGHRSEPVAVRRNAAVPVAGFGAVLDGDDSRARVDVGVRLDLGGIGKGYAADLARDRCIQAGVESVMISIGSSSIAVAGPAPVPGSWRIGLRSPWHDIPESVGYVTVADGSVSVSGSDSAIGPEGATQRGHIYDPLTGQPAATSLCAVGVIGADGSVCEALSTGVMVLGVERGLSLCTRIPGVEAVLFTVSGRIVATAGLASRMVLRTGIQDRLAQHRAAQR